MPIWIGMSVKTRKVIYLMALNEDPPDQALIHRSNEGRKSQ